MLCRYMRPFTRYLAMEAAAFPEHSVVRHHLSTSARSEIEM